MKYKKKRAANTHVQYVYTLVRDHTLVEVDCGFV